MHFSTRTQLSHVLFFLSSFFSVSPFEKYSKISTSPIPNTRRALRSSGCKATRVRSSSLRGLGASVLSPSLSLRFSHLCRIYSVRSAFGGFGYETNVNCTKGRERESKDAPRALSATWCPRRGHSESLLVLLTIASPGSRSNEVAGPVVEALFGSRREYRAGSLAQRSCQFARARARTAVAKKYSLWRHLHLTIRPLGSRSVYRLLHAGKTHVGMRLTRRRIT